MTQKIHTKTFKFVRSVCFSCFTFRVLSGVLLTSAFKYVIIFSRTLLGVHYMDWEVVKVRGSLRNAGRGNGRDIPYASVGFGRLSLNLVACEMIDAFDQCKYVELLRGRHKNKACVGVRFLLPLETSPDMLPIRRRIHNGVPGGGVDIHGKRIMEELFGPAASATKTTRYSVEKDNRNDNILIIFAE